MEEFQKRSVETNRQIARVRDSAESAGKDMENSGKRAAQFFASAKTEALALMSVLTGGAGLITAASATAASIADLGRAAQNLNGMNPQALDAWGMALKRIGGDAQNAVTSFNNIGSALARYRLKGDTAIIPFLNAIGAQTTMTPEQIAIKFSEYIKAHPEKTAQEVNVIGQGIGFTQDMTNLLRHGPEAVRRELDLSRQLGLRTQAMIETATQFQHDFEALNQAAGHLKDKMMTQMMPTIDAFIVGLTNWIINNPNAAEAAAVGGSVLGGAAGTSVLARMLGLTALADAAGTVTAALLRFAGVLGLISLTGVGGGQATQAETDATTERLRREGLLPAGPSRPLPSNYLDPNSGPSIWGWVKRKLGWSGESSSGSPTTDPSGGGSSGGVDPSVRGRARAVHDEFVKQGTDDETAWALAANSVQESQANPNSRPGDMGRAHGLFMWRDDAESGGRALQFQKMFGHMPEQGTLEEAVKFARWELENTERGAAGEIARAKGAGAKAAAVSRFYLRPKDREAEMERRARIANSLLPGPRAASLDAPHLMGYTGEPGLLPAAGARGEDIGGHPTPASQLMQVGNINIHTQATKADDIAKEIHGALSDRMIQQANRGLF